NFGCTPLREDEPPYVQGTGTVTFTMTQGCPGHNEITVSWDLTCDCGSFTGSITHSDLGDSGSIDDETGGTSKSILYSFCPNAFTSLQITVHTSGHYHDHR